MKFFQWSTDGGKESHVTGLFIVELKLLFSIVLLHFKNGTREAYHSHAFNAITWLLKGKFTEHHKDGHTKDFHPSFKPKITKRDTFHKVFSHGDTWAISLRGPWQDTWEEYLPSTNECVTLTNGRKIIGRRPAAGVQ